MEDTVFHKIMRREIPAPLLRDTPDFIAIRDINPIAPTHILIIPRKSIPRLTALTADDAALVGSLVLAAKEIASELGLDADGYRLVFNCGEHGGQTVEQLHLHLVGGRPFAWPPG